MSEDVGVCVCVSLEMIPLWWAWGHWDLDALAVMLAVCAWLWRVVGSCGSLPRGGYKKDLRIDTRSL